MSSWARGLHLGRSLDLHPYLMYASSDGSGESAHMHICADSPEPSLLDKAAIICIQVKMNMMFYRRECNRRHFQGHETVYSSSSSIQVNAPPPSSLYLAPIKCSKNSYKLLFLFSNKRVVTCIKAGNNKMLVRIANM